MRLFPPSFHQKLIIEDVTVMMQRAKFGAIGCDYMTCELKTSKLGRVEHGKVTGSLFKPFN